VNVRNERGTRHRSRNKGCLGAAAAFLVVGLLFGSLFAARAWRDVRIFTVWRPATCTVVEMNLRSTGGSGRSKPSYRPDITFTYEVGGKQFRCTGWDSWALAGDFGGGSHEYYTRVLERYEVGRAYPCWYDPADPSRAVLVRRIRPLYILAVMPLALTALGAIGLWASFASPERRLGSDGKSEARRRSQAGHERAGAKALWDEQRLAQRLRPDSRPGDQSCGALLVSVALLFVGGLAGYAVWSDYQDGTWHFIPVLFVVVFGGLGFLFLWITAASGLASHVPETIVEVERSEIAPGERTAMVILQPGPLRLRSLRVKLACREETPEKEGSPRVAVLHDEVVTAIARTTVGRDVPLVHSAELRIPADAKPSSGGPPVVRWRLEVWGVPLVWPRFMLTFPIMVVPEAPEAARETTNRDPA
jgi:hypothetical protein